MAKFSSPLDNVHVAAPCPADWNEMHGDERARFCNQCQLNVYNLSAMTRQEAEQLLREREGRLCVRFYRRTDGTIITENCPKGLAALKRRVTRTATAVFSSILAFLSGVGVYSITNVPTFELQGEMAVPLSPEPEEVEELPIQGQIVRPILLNEVKGRYEVGVVPLIETPRPQKPVQIKKRGQR